MTAPAAAPARPRVGPSAVDIVLLTAAKLSVGALVLALGFVAISDDDYARVVIAQRFAEAPSLDPSGTSWLPLPFWIYGVAFRAFGPSLHVARGVAMALGVLAVLVLFAGARLLGLNRRASAFGAAVAGSFPYSAYLGVATVPEASTAALTVFGAFALTTERLRLLGGAALFGACASRYEPWAVAAVFAAVTTRDALRKRDSRLALAACAAAAFPLLWLAHGVARHGDPFFFVARVTAYRAALGLTDEHPFAALLRSPLRLLVAEPELVGCAAIAAFAAQRALTSSSAWRALGLLRLLACAGALLAFLMLGDLRGSAPTHHGERALLPIWFGLAVLVGWGLDRALAATPRQRMAGFSAALGALVLGAVVVRQLFPRDAFGDRRPEVEIGSRARARSIDDLAIHTEDFGYFAVQAAFGRPSHTLILDDRDPRRGGPAQEQRSGPESPSRSRGTPPLRLASGYRWFVLPTTKVGELPTTGRVREQNSRLSLVELAPSSESRRR